MIEHPTICLASESDAKAIAAMSRDQIEYGLGWSWTHARVASAIRNTAMNVAVIQQQGSVIAFGIMEYGERKAHLSLLGVRPGQRRRGLARSVVVWLEKCADTCGLEFVQVEARADNPGAVAFYLSLGYKEVSRLTGYYRGVIDAIRFEKRLWVVPREART
jgi:ribosomal-protein-alanine N-acetyltransferase